LPNIEKAQLEKNLLNSLKRYIEDKHSRELEDMGAISFKVNLEPLPDRKAVEMIVFVEGYTPSEVSFAVPKGAKVFEKKRFGSRILVSSENLQKDNITFQAVTSHIIRSLENALVMNCFKLPNHLTFGKPDAVVLLDNQNGFNLEDEETLQKLLKLKY